MTGIQTKGRVLPVTDLCLVVLVGASGSGDEKKEAKAA